MRTSKKGRDGAPDHVEVFRQFAWNLVGSLSGAKNAPAGVARKAAGTGQADKPRRRAVKADARPASRVGRSK